MCPVPPRFFFLFSACVTDGHSFRTHSSPGNEGAVINISALGPLAAGETRKGGGREQQKWRGPLHRLKRKGGRPLRFFLLKKESLRQVEKRDTHARTVLCLFLEVKTAAFGFHREMTSRYVGAFFLSF